MVMHARKYPRLNDGYYERGQGHSYEDKPPSKSRSSKYVDPKESPSGGGYSRHREESPVRRPSPRYQNKASYSDRDKDRMARVSSDSPGEKRANHSSLSHRSSSSNKNGKGRDHHREKDSHKSEIQKSAITVDGDWSEHRSSSGKKYYYNCKTEVSQWEKPKEWNDPPSSKSEMSRKERDFREKSGSKGHDEHRPHKHSTVDKYSSSSRHSTGTERSYSTPDSSSKRHPAATTPSSTHKLLHQQKSWPQEQQQHHHRGGGGGPNSISSKHEQGLRGTPDHSSIYEQSSKHGLSRNSTMSNSGDPREQRGRGALHALTRSALHDDARQAEDMEISPGSTPTEESMSEKLHHPHHHQHHPHHHHQHPHSSSSHHPGSSSYSTAAAAASSSSTNSAAALPPHSSSITTSATMSSTSCTSSSPSAASAAAQLGAALPSLLNQLNDSEAAAASAGVAGGNLQSSITHQAIQTLQKLQEALMAQQRQQQQRLAHLLQQQQQQSAAASTAATNTTTTTTTTTSHHQQQQLTQNGGKSPESDGTPLQSPELHLSDSAAAAAAVEGLIRPHYVGMNTGESPKSDDRNRRGSSPSLSQTSGVMGSHLSAAAKKSDSIELPPSLANYYDDSLICHVSSWMEEGRGLERAADRFSEEAHNIGALGSTQTSADLKKARSWVRVSEIQSTLQEQRILFLRQQIRDLENMRSQNTFMPGDT